MPLSMGTRLGPYEILAPVGAGGMGEVYKARDTRLDRIVALKVSAAQFSERFEREAHAIGALNHPNICTLYDVGPNYLVMEYVEGAPLKGPLSVDQALKYGVQICAALDHAHKKGFTHRDLKPANILVTKAGIKLLDFGLAKLSSGSQAAKPPDDATLTMALTGKNEIIGTLYYMSPEQLQAQANGQEIDGRSDIFSFGLVLYEMLTGKRAFEGSSPASVIAAIMDRPAPSIADVAPPALDRVLKKCLAKDPEDRWHSARDLKDEIEWIANTPAIDAKSKPARSQSRLGWVAASLAVVSIVLGGLYWRATRPVDRALMRLSVDLGPDAVAGQFTTAVISPDGSRLVFPVKSPDGKQLLASRLLSETKPTLLSGTENGRDPFFSPDGTWIGFFADGKMKKIPVQGGASVVLCETPNPRGAAWRDDGTIVAAFNVNGALSRISSGGGTPQPVTKLQGALTHRWPQTLPGSEAVLFTLSRSIVDFEDASIAAVSLKTGEIKVLVRGGYFGRYLPTSGSTGHLVYVHDGVLFAVPFDPARLELRGTAVPMLEDLAGDPNSGAGQFTSTGQGTLVYRAGKVSVESWPVWWLDSSGKTTPLITTLGYYVMPRFSPDGQRLALLRSAGSSNGIIVYDLQRDTVSRLAFDSQQPVFPEWSPDGKHIVFRFSSPNGFSLGWIRADGAGETQHLLDSKNIVIPSSFFPDGRRLAYHEYGSDSGYDLWTLALDMSDPDHPKPGKPELFLGTPSSEMSTAVSPDGRWVAYQSDESGRPEVYVRPFPGPDGKWQISSAGGTLPVWSRNSRELFFENLENRIMVADYESKKESFVAGRPRLWSDQQLHDANGAPNYDVAPNGKRLAILPELKAAAEEKGDVHATFLLNFFDELRRKVPVGK